MMQSMISKTMRSTILVLAMTLPCAALAQPAPVVRLSLAAAEQIAQRNNPDLTVARLAAMASREAYRESRSSLLPTATSNLTAVDTDNGNRISAGALNNPVIYERAAYGATVAQLITDFGRTRNTVAGARYRASAQQQLQLASANQLRLAVDRAFYRALAAGSVLNVARQTVEARQTLAEQVEALTRSKLRSLLDLSFARTNLEQARLMLLDAENQYAAELAALSDLLGYATPQNFELVDEAAVPSAPPADVTPLVESALVQRPELKAQQLQLEAAHKLQSAAWEQSLPSVRALGVVGQAPVRDPHITSWYGAVGVNVEIPIFTGFRINAQSHEARLAAEAEDAHLTALRNSITRDVNTSWLAENTAYRRLSVTSALLEQAHLALDLSQTRYKLGLASIVEVSQAQLQATSAEIENARARYDCLLAEAVVRFETNAP
jgi:outer membrane protein